MGPLRSHAGPGRLPPRHGADLGLGWGLRSVIPAIPLLILLLSGCSDSGTSPILGELNSRLAAWEARGIRDYAFTYQRTCNQCTEEEQARVRIQVRQGQVAGVERLDTGEELPASAWGAWPTIHDLFQDLLDHARNEVGQTSVIFNEDWDIPAFATAVISGVIGGGFSFTTGDFAPE
jgi:hypothetical protein